MSRVKISATVEQSVVAQIDNLVQQKIYPNRSAAIEGALEQVLRAQMDARIEAEAAKLNRREETELAEWGMEDYAALVKENRA